MLRIWVNRGCTDGKLTIGKAFLTPVMCAFALTLVVASLAPEHSTEQTPTLVRPLDHVALTTGSSWAIQGFGTNIGSISCVSADTCMAIGIDADGKDTNVLATTDGVNWSTRDLFDEGSENPGFSWVTCVSASTCWAASAGYGANMYETTNWGSSWTTATMPTQSGYDTPDNPATNISCPSTTVCFVGIGYGPYFTPGIDELTSGTWTTSTASLPGGYYGVERITSISCPSTSVCVATGTLSGGSEAVWYTSNGGSTWSLEQPSVINGTLTDISCPSTSYCEVAAEDTSYGHWYTMYSTSSPLGSSWASDTPSPTPDGGAASVSCVAADECEVVGNWAPNGSSTTEYYAEQGGGSSSSWTMQLSDPPAFEQFTPPRGPSSVDCVASDSTQVCYLATPGGLMRSSDGGSTWVGLVNEVLPPPGSYTYPYANSMSCPGKLTCYMVGNGQVYVTTSGGEEWDATPMDLGIGASSSLDVVACASTTTCVAAGGAGSGGGADPNDGTALLVETTNGGASWSELSDVPGIGQLSAIACPSTSICVIGRTDHFGSPNISKLAVGDPSTSSWTTVTSDDWTYGNVTSISCPSVTVCFATTATNHILYSTGGSLSSWSVASVAGSWNAIACTSTTTCIAAGADDDNHGSVAETTDGTSWSIDGSPPSSYLPLTAAACASSSQCDVGNVDGLFQGTFGSWTNVLPEGVTDYTAQIGSIACGDADDCYAVAYMSGDQSLLLSNNGIVAPDDGAVEPAEIFSGVNPSEPCFACYLKSLGGSAQAFVGDPVDTATGDFTESVPLISIPARGLPFGVTLSYDAQMAQSQVAADDSSPGPFGWGWTSNDDMSVTSGPGGDQVTVNQEGGSQVIFTAGTTVDDVTPYTAVDPDRVTATLSYSTLSNEYTFERNGGLEQFTFNSSGDLVSESDANGNTTTFGTESTGTDSCPDTDGVVNCSTITDPGDRTITLVNMSSGLVSEVIDPVGNTWDLGYDDGNLTSITDPDSNETTFGYDTSNDNDDLVHDMTSIIRPANQLSGHATTNTYDDTGRVISQTDPAGLTTTYSYEGDNESSTGGTTTITDPHGNVTTQDYAYGVLWSTTSGAGTADAATWSYERDPATLLPTEVIDPTGNITTSTFDSNGNPLTVTDPDGNETTNTYNSFNEVLTSTDPLGIETENTYDDYGNLTEKAVDGLDSTDISTSYTVCESSCPDGFVRGDVESMTDPNGKTTSYTYDADGDLTSSSITVGELTDTTTYAYNNLGQLYCEVSPDANAASVTCPSFGDSRHSDTTTYAYDADGNETSSTDADGNETTYSYDADNNQTEVTDPLDNVTKTTYDADDRVSTVTDGYGSASSTTTTYTYDIAAGSCPSAPDGTTYCTQVENGLDHTTTSYYDALDDMIEQAPPNTTDQSAATYTYDGDGNVLTLTDGSGTTSYTYDGDNQVTAIDYSDAGSGYTAPTDVTYSYDADGNRTEMTDGTGTTDYYYDGLGRLDKVDDGYGHVVTYKYDDDGNTTCLSYPVSGDTTCLNASSGTGLVTYTYNAADQPITMTDWLGDGNETTFAYDNDSNLTKITYPSGTSASASYSYDDTDALTDTSYTIGDTTTDLAALGRNADELISTTSSPSTTYGYDALNRVTTGVSASYTYDDASEITSATPTEGSATDYEYNADGQLCWTGSTTDACGSAPSGATTYSYDSAGDRLRSTPSDGHPTTYGWDQAGNMVCETAPNASSYSCASPNSSVTSTYSYNGDGLRMSDTPAGGSEQQFTWDVSGSVPQLLEDGTNYYLYGPNIGSAPLEQISISDPTPTYLVSDTTGVREQISSSGSIISSMSYDTYGNPCDDCSISTPFGFEGGYTDATGLVYLVHRYYDPATEQFLSVDPLVDQTGTPYAFVNGDPVNETDPNGQGFLGALVDSLNPFSQNNVFYRFGYHHPLAGRVVAGGAALTAGALGLGACLAGGCTAIAAAAGGTASAGATEDEDESPGFFASLGQRCQAFFGDETGAVEGPWNRKVPSWVLEQGISPELEPDQSPVQRATNIMNKQFGEGNWSKGPRSDFNILVKWITARGR